MIGLWQKIKDNRKALFRSAFVGLLLFGLFFTIGFIRRYHIPKLQNWALIEIEKYSRENLPIRIWPKAVKMNFWPLGITFTDIDILPKGDLQKDLAPIRVEDASVSLNLLSLFIGEVRFSSVHIKSPVVMMTYSSEDLKKQTETSAATSKKPSSPAFSFKKLSHYPVDEIYIEDLDFMVRDKSKKVSFRTSEFNLTIKNLTELFLLEANTPSLVLLNHESRSLLNLLVDAKFLLNDNSAHLSSLKLKNKETYLVASGLVEGQILKGQFSKIQFNTRSQIEFASLVKSLNPFINNRLPQITGSTSLDVSYNKEKDEIIEFDVNTNKVFIEKMEVGQVIAKGSYNNSKLNFARLSAHTSAGHAHFKEVKIETKSPYKFSTLAEVKRLEIRQLLRSLNIGSTPLHLPVDGTLPCSGQLKPDVKLECKGIKLNVTDFLVHNGDKVKTPIIAVNQIDIWGDARVDSKGVYYDGHLKIQETLGKSRGEILFDKGFDIKYETESIDFKHVDNLINLDYEGQLKIKGHTKGTSQWATVDMNVAGQNLWFENYKLGEAKFDFSYKKGILKFQNIKAKQNTSEYSGRVSINLLKDSIYLKFDSKYLDTEDIMESFSRKVDLPIDITGSGVASVKAWGPLQFNLLSYDFTSSLFRGQIAREPYDDISAHIVSKNGYVKTKSFQVKKGSGTITMNAEVNPQGNMKTQIVGRQLKLEESENLNRLSLNMTGILNVNTTLTGYILNPNTEIVGNVSKVEIAEVPVPNSNFNLVINKGFMKGKGLLMGNTLTTDFKIPFIDNEEFWFRLDTKNWNFTRFFSVFSNVEEQKKYQTAADINIDIRSQRGGFWASTGEVNIPKVKIKKNNITMFNPKPMQISFFNGRIKSKDFRLVGDNTYLDLEINNLTKNQFNAKLNGKLKMTLLNILTPLQDMGGDLNVNLNLSGNYNTPNLRGDAFVKNGFARLEAFPHPIEDVSGHAILTEKKVRFERARGIIANGTLESSGEVQFNKFGDIPVDISGIVRNANLEFPKGIATSGNALVKVKGNWFPYILDIDYSVRKGLFSREFEDEETNLRTIKPSSFLPKFLVNDSFQSFDFDVDIKMDKPLKVKNSQTDALFLGNLKIKGSPDNPLFTGKVNSTQEGTLVFRQNEFEIVNANLNYENAPVDNPKLYITAQTQIVSDDLTYEVKLIVQGTANKPEITMTSLPPLQEYEIVSLLAVGMTSEQADENVNAEDLAEQTSYQLGSALLASPLGKQIKNRFGFDFQISSEFDEDNEVIPKVTIKRQITPKLDATATRTLEQNPKNKVKVKYKVNKSLSVIGTWDGNETTAEDNDQEGNSSVIGVDLEYKLKFR